MSGEWTHEVSIDGITPPTNHLAVLTSPLLHAFNCTHMAYTAYQGSASCLRAPREASNDFFFWQTLTIMVLPPFQIAHISGLFIQVAFTMYLEIMYI
jgi:hypothetical protein